MNEHDAIAFLTCNQPMPDDDKLSEELIYQYDQVRKFLAAHPSEDGVRLILTSFGIGDGWGVYPLVEDAVRTVSAEVVVEHLTRTLRSPFVGVRYWGAQIAAYYEDRRLIEPLRDLLYDSSEDVRAAAVVSLEKYIDEGLKETLRSMLSRDSSASVRAILKDILNEAT